jgi:hypothetical protein
MGGFTGAQPGDKRVSGSRTSIPENAQAQRTGHRCDKALSLWVQGPRRTKPGTQPPGAQFLRDSATGEVYGEGKPAPLKLRCRVLNLLQLMRKPTTSRRETSFIQDRVSIGEVAASDYLSENIARFSLLHKYTQVRGLNINTP